MMRLNHNQIRELAKVTIATRPDEIDCDQWLDQVAGYAEAVAKGGPIPSEYQAVSDHLAVCPECSEEYEDLIEFVKSESGH